MADSSWIIVSSNRIARLGCVAVLAAVTMAACGSDGPDAYTAPDTTESPDTTEAVTDAADRRDTVDATPADTATESAASGETVEVKALDNTFIEDTVEVAAGTEVVWRNGGRNDHDIVPVARERFVGCRHRGVRPG